MPYTYIYSAGRPDCTVTGIEGYVVGANGLAEAQTQVRIGNDQGWTVDIKTDADGYYIWHFSQEPVVGKWFVRVFKNGLPSSEKFWWETSAGCTGPYSLQWVRIDWRHR
jgi:hypothetical protein